MAVGFWGRSVHQRIIADQQLAKERALLLSQIEAGGVRTSLWRSSAIGTKCACYKESNQQSDRKCKSCHGTGAVPGYLKFGYNTVWMSVVDSDVTLTNCNITTEFKSAKAILSATALTGVVESGDKPFTRSVVGSAWAYDVASYVRIGASSSVVVEYSTNSGLTWAAIAALPTANPASGAIRFRATLTRTSTAIMSPLFEIVRARYETLAFSNQQADGSYRRGPWILVMRNIPKSRFTKTEHGDAPFSTDLNFWTTGLSYFDTSIVLDSVEELIKPVDEGPCDFIEFMDGVATGDRYIVIERQFSDPMAQTLLDQNFIARLSEQNIDQYALVW